MDPATISLIVMLISYYISSKSGKSKGQSAAIAAAAGVGSYYALSPEGLNLYNTGAKALGLDGTAAADADGKRVTSPTGVKSVSATGGINGVVGTVGDVLKSWGPVGTAGVIGTTALTTQPSWQKYVPWALAGLGAYLLLK